MKNTGKKLALLLAVSLMLPMIAACGGSSSNNSTAPTSAPAKEESAAASAASEAKSEAAASSTAETADDASSDPAVTIKFSMNTAESSMTGLQYKAFKDLVEEESGGSITFEIYSSGSLVDDAGALDAVMDGTCDAAHGMVAYLDGVIKDLTPLEIPGYYSGESFADFASATNGILSDIFADYDIKFIGSNFQGQSAFVATDGCITQPSDLKGQSVRAAGTYIAKAVEAWGGSPTTVSLADLTSALERKTVDSAYTGYSIVGGFKLYEMAPYVTYTTITESYAALIMNMNKWNSLTANQQAAVERAAERWTEQSYGIGMDFRTQYIDEMTAAGVEIADLDSAATKAFTDLTAPLFDEVEGSLGEKGQTLLSTLKELNG